MHRWAQEMKGNHGHEGGRLTSLAMAFELVFAPSRLAASLAQLMSTDRRDVEHFCVQVEQATADLDALVSELAERIDTAEARLAERPAWKRFTSRLGLRRTALDDLDVVPPVERRESRRVAHEHPHPVARREKPGHEPTADVACRAEHERARRRAVRARLGAQGLFTPRGGRQLGHAASVRRSARSGAGLAPGRRAR